MNTICFANLTRRPKGTCNPGLRCVVSACVAVAMLASAASAQAPSTKPLGPAAEPEATINEKLGDTVPLDLEFRNHKGEPVTLGEYFANGQPVLITPIYFRCPQLCSLTLNGLLNGMDGMELTAGTDFQVVTYSFNPDEGPELADVKRRAYLSVYNRDAAESGWHFLTGEREQINLLSDAIGFEFDYNEETGEYIHPPAAIFVTPDGRISRYMSDVMFAPRDLRFALIEASQGSIGSPMERFALRLCYQYDPNTNTYVASAWKIMRLGGALTVLALGVILGTLFYLDWKKAKQMNSPKDASTPQPRTSGGALEGSSL